jgi:hypothetical protein
LGVARRELFLRKGLDGANHVELAWEIDVCEQALKGAGEQRALADLFDDIGQRFISRVIERHVLDFGHSLGVRNQC